ncbi:hypothetical protein BDY17DRAFT_243945 [Neohortaea acidophila]|uniref:Uncharacterized protein n=1 Tax=Neohortaea acidophila TaxID=245834 RepID=A0A6A6Q4W9_9PEZI|nr:uncharacterized protein BDY17DRAFT_243945 [Neohortaea acidophila]KAF2486996.1 hypothetical protein BDY17DRAFT_243945 [Neohortaea acidophila]
MARRGQASIARHKQDDAYEQSIKDPEKFWTRQAKQLVWHKEPTHAYAETQRKLDSGTEHRAWSWFPDGEISTTYNCLERHIEAGNGDNVAIIWDSPVTKQKEKYTYSQLQEEVATLAGVLKEEGVGKGDVVCVYMPMIPAALIGILAVARLGAIHAVVFGGFSASSLAQRIEASSAQVILTASCGIEGAKGPLPYSPMVRGAVKESPHKPQRTIIWQREQSKWEDLSEQDGERDWKQLVAKAKERGLKADNVPVKSTDGLYIIYTSGTTGLPKGVLRTAGGHAVQLNLSIRYLFGIRGPGDVIFTASDIGWVVGHSYILYAPLLAGATSVLFEGKPIGTPDAGTFWRMLEEHKVNTFFTAPTALRAIRKEDPENKFFKKRGEAGGLKNLRALFLAGERSEPSIINLYHDLVQKYAAPGAQVIDHWWSSESGSPMTGLTLMPNVAFDAADTEFSEQLPIKPGSAGKPLPGFEIKIVDDDGKEVGPGEMGNIVLGIPFAPSGFTTLWRDDERFWKSYLRRFNGKWMDTGDAGLADENGYIWVMSRADDVINVAAHRLSTGAIEQAIGTHPDITEVAVVPIPDEMKGHIPFAFVGLENPPDDLLKDLNERLRKHIGPIAMLGGFISQPGVIPKTRSGKTLRRCLKEIVENALNGEFDKEITVPATVEDASVVDKAKAAAKDYFTNGAGAKLKAKL